MKHRTENDPHRTRIRDWALAILVVAVIGFAPKDADAHVITPADCRAVATHTTGISAVKRAASRGCMRSAAAHALDHQFAACDYRPTYQARNACTIRLVFGPAGNDAVTIATCESGLSTRAVGPVDERGNPRPGLFQLGTYERGRAGEYSTSSSARVQATSALRWFQLTGSDWDAWECTT